MLSNNLALEVRLLLWILYCFQTCALAKGGLRSMLYNILRALSCSEVSKNEIDKI